MNVIKSLFRPDYERYDGVRRINIYLMRLLYILMLLFLGKDSWTYILTHQGAWAPDDAMAWSVWAAFATLGVLGILQPVKMIPLLLLEVFYKVLWLVLVAYPLWKVDGLIGSPVEDANATQAARQAVDGRGIRAFKSDFPRDRLTAANGL